MNSFPDHLDPQQNPWLQDAGLRQIMDVIKAGSGGEPGQRAQSEPVKAEARPVGGAVRDALLGKKVGEVDLAVNLPPDKVTELLTAAGIKVVPTGVEHGTVTAVVGHQGYELTTLRRDIETDGRHAKVTFTTDWREDAARRDFTFNALYVDSSGAIFDYFGGRADLASGHVRFIGDAHERIKEDVLRILRFFRFYAWYGKGDVDQAGLEACCQMASLLPQLSVERVWREIGKLLTADDPCAAWKLMLDGKVLDHFLPEAHNKDALQGLIAVEKKYDIPPAPLVRLAALIPKDYKLAAFISQRLKMSKREQDALRTLVILPGLLRGKLDPVPLRRALYEQGTSSVRDAVMLVAAEDSAADITPALKLVAEWQELVFPLQGEDLLKLGMTPGPKVGEVLRAVEEWWIDSDFRPSRDECLKEAVTDLQV
jgi:poly(A) polymerase